MRTVFPIGTTVYNPGKCWNGYTILNSYVRGGHHSKERIMQSGTEGSAEQPQKVDSKSELEINIIDMNGSIVNGWETLAFRNPKLLSNGNLLVAGSTGKKTLGWFLEGHPTEYDWEGNVVWEAFPPVKPHGAGSVALRLENGNTLFYYKIFLPDEFRLRIDDPEWRSKDGILSDCIAEVTPDGKVVWDWRSHEHLDLNGWLRNDPNPNWTHFNNLQPLPENKWYDEGDERFKPGNILVSGRTLGFIFIVSKETGEIVWRYTGNHLGGLAGQHSPYMIEKGLPGEGNILIFDNGQSPLRYDRHGGQSVVLEIDPSVSKVKSGQEIVWSYGNSFFFYNPYGGHCERLPNGNTLITESHTCRVFEVTPEKEIVWEFVRDPAPWLLIMDAQRIPYDHCPQLAAMPKPQEKEVIPPPGTALKPY